MFQIKLDKSQSQTFAQVIYEDIKGYLDTHLEDYQKFIAEEDNVFEVEKEN